MTQKYKVFSKASGLPEQPERLKAYWRPDSLQEASERGIIKPKFATRKLLQVHYERHKGEFGDITESEYSNMAAKLVRARVSDDVQELVRSDGSKSKYKFSTNEFVVITKDGAIRTYFKPIIGKGYWEYEHERN